MQCPRCHAENAAGISFCGQCAAPLASLCPSCGAASSPESRFCGQCAAPLGQRMQPRFASPDAYTPQHLAQKILTSKVSLEGERKQITVLFADMKGSMELLADRDPEEARKILDPILEQMMEAVHRYEGTVNQVMGDGIMALFGAPLAHEDHAVRACYAALGMQEAVKRYAEGVRPAEGVPIRIRVGLNSGEVVVRSVGSDLRMDYTAVGQTTHLAARMEQMADPGTILMTADTLRLAEGFVRVQSLGPVSVKGLTAPVETFALTGATPTPSRLQAAAARGLTKFVGRNTELVQLQEALELAKAGQGQVVAVVGEPGVGKSRLFWEFTHSHRTQDCLILEATSASYGKATPYLPVADLLRAYFQIEPGDEPRKRREKVTGKLLSLDEDLRPTLPPILSLLDLPVDEGAWLGSDTLERRRRTLDAVTTLLLRESRAQSLVVIFEDLHWADSETQASLDALVEALPTTPILLVVSYRPEYEDRWGNKDYYRRLPIDALPPGSAEEMAEALVGRDPSLERLRALLVERTEGNPLFIEESVRTLVEIETLVGEPGTYRLAAPVTHIQVPPSVQGVLAARIDRLPPAEKRLLQSASVIGKDVPLILLRCIADLPEEALNRCVTNLKAAHFLYETAWSAHPEYTFRHALTHDVAYASLLHERRRALHAQIVEAIEQLYGDRLTEHVDRLAHHAERGGLWDKGVNYLLEAGRKAAGRSANKEAVAYFEQALAGLARLPEERDGLEHAIDLRFGLRNALLPLGDLARILFCLDEARRLASKLGDPRRLAWVSIYTSAHIWQVGRAADARAFAEEGQAIAEQLGDFSLRVAAAFYLGQAHFVLGDYRSAESSMRSSLRLLESQASNDLFGLAGLPVAMSGSYLAWALAECGEFDEAIARGEEAVRLAEARDHRYSQILAWWRLACAYNLRGDFAKAITLLERGDAAARESSVALLVPYVMWSLGYAYAHTGRPAEGLALLSQSLDRLEALGSVAFDSLARTRLTEVSLLTGRIEEATVHAERSLAAARTRGERGHEAWALRAVGDVASHRGPLAVQEAETRYRDALAVAHELGMRPLIAHCHLGLGKLYRRTGKKQDAREHLASAATMYREMDMRFWLEQAERK